MERKKLEALLREATLIPGWEEDREVSDALAVLNIKEAMELLFNKKKGSKVL